MNQPLPPVLPEAARLSATPAQASSKAPLPLWRCLLGLGAAITCDTLLALFAEAPLFGPGFDLLACGILSLILGVRFIFLPAFILEAIPALGLFPFWTISTLYVIFSNRRKQSP